VHDQGSCPRQPAALCANELPALACRAAESGETAERAPFPVSATALSSCLCFKQGSISAAEDTPSSDQPPQRKSDLKDEPRSTSPDPKGKKSKRKKPKEKVSVGLKQQREKGWSLSNSTDVPSACR